VVPVFFHSTTRTTIRPVGHGHFLPVAAGGTCLGRIGRIHLPELSTGTHSLVREEGEELRPRHVTDASIEASVRVHFVDGDVFHKDPSVLMDDLSGFLMSKVGSPEGGPFMDLRHHLFGLRSFRRSLCLPLQFPLGLRQSLCRAFQKLRVFDDRSVRKSGEGLDPHIDPDRERIGRKNPFRNVLAGKSHPPFSGGRPENGAGLDLSGDRAMENDRNGSDLGQAKTVARQITPDLPLGEGQRRVLSLSLEAGVAGVLAVFCSPKKRLKGQIDANGHILECLGIDRRKSWTDLFQGRERSDLVVQGQAHSVLVPRIPPMFQKMVIEPTALFHLLVQKRFLFAGRIQPILERFSHIVISVLRRTMSQGRTLTSPP